MTQPHRHCSAHECIAVIRRKDRMPPTQYQMYLQQQRQVIRAQREKSAREKQQQATVDAREHREHEQILRYVSDKYGDTPLLASIPSGPASIKPVPENRRQAYIRYLHDSIKEATSGTSLIAVDAKPNELTEEMTNAPGTPNFCARCKGGCCTLGKNKGYLSPLTLRQKLKSNPDMTPAEIVEHYISLIPDASVEGSCINHTSTGCALPREWRSDTCNRFYCSPLKDYFKQRHTSNDTKSTVIVQRNCTHWNRYTLDQQFSVTDITYIDSAGKTKDTLPDSLPGPPPAST